MAHDVSLDPRHQRSRALLDAAILDLAAEAPVGHLTMTAVARAAGVHRSTVYEHGSSPADLLRQALIAELDLLRADLLRDPNRATSDAMAEVTGRVLEHILRHGTIYRRGLAAGSGDDSLHGMLSDHFAESIRHLDEQGRLAWPGPIDGLSDGHVKEVAARFVAQGTVGAIQGWLTQADPTVDSFGRLYRELVPEWWIPSAA